MTTALVLAVMLQPVLSEVVPCPDQQPYCSCSPDAQVCEFTLRIEMRQTFTSFKLTDGDKKLTFEGVGYFLNESGYIPTSEGQAACFFDDVGYKDSDFTRRNCSVPMTVDGVNYRNVISINGQIPGPTLIVTQNQTVVVHVINLLTCDAISVHWHGLWQRNTPWMDGVGFITQPPIDPGSTFDYIFIAGQSGTYWYHSHIGPQRSEGLYGGLVLRDPVDFFNETVRPRVLPEDSGAVVVDSPEVHTVTMIDWMKELSLDLFVQINDSLSIYPDSPVLSVPTRGNKPYEGPSLIDGTGTGPLPFWSGLINGRGRFNDSTLTPLSVFSVEPNRYYRFRLVGATTNFAYNFSIDGHILRAIASDGEYFEPKDVEYIVVHAGERYDFLLNTTGNRVQDNFWMHAETMIALNEGEVQHSAVAILSYNNGSDLDWRNGYTNVPEIRHNCSSDNPCRVLNCPFESFPHGSPTICVSLLNLTALFPSLPDELPKFPPDNSCSDCMHFLDFGFQGPNTDSSINAKSFQLPDTAYSTNCEEFTRSQATINTCDKCDFSGGGCRCINVIPLANNATFDSSSREHESIVMVFSAINARTTHPIHMHGHTYTIVYIGYGKYNETTGKVIEPTKDIVCNQNEGNVCASPRWANGTPPDAIFDRIRNGRVVDSAISKDTVMVPGYGYVVVAIQANNPGYWFLHCHIEHHQLSGMTALLQEYAPYQHRAPPVDINFHGSFQWTVEEFREFQQEAAICAEVVRSSTIAATPTPGGVSSIDNVVVLSRAEFGLMVALIVIFFVLTVILLFIVILFCVRPTKTQKGTDADLRKEPAETKAETEAEVSIST